VTVTVTSKTTNANVTSKTVVNGNAESVMQSETVVDRAQREQRQQNFDSHASANTAALDRGE